MYTKPKPDAITTEIPISQQDGEKETKFKLDCGRRIANLFVY